ncbi:hypothetical protein BJX76DRAFT_165826 [Aspergillus varians]
MVVVPVKTAAPGNAHFPRDSPQLTLPNLHWLFRLRCDLDRSPFSSPELFRTNMTPTTVRIEGGDFKGPGIAGTVAGGEEVTTFIWSNHAMTVKSKVTTVTDTNVQFDIEVTSYCLPGPGTAYAQAVIEGRRILPAYPMIQIAVDFFSHFHIKVAPGAGGWGWLNHAVCVGACIWAERTKLYDVYLMTNFQSIERPLAQDQVQKQPAQDQTQNQAQGQAQDQAQNPAQNPAQPQNQEQQPGASRRQFIMP